MAEKQSVLVVANRTAESEELLEALKQRAGEGEVAFTLLVPTTPRGLDWAAVPEETGDEEAEQHLSGAIARLREAGLEVEGRLGDPQPLAAVEDAVNFGKFDAVIVSTLPTHLSKWLKMDLPHRVEGATGLPVTHVVASEPDS